MAQTVVSECLDVACRALISECNSQCVGRASEMCGGSNRLVIYYGQDYGGPFPPQPTILPVVGKWESLGCYR
jgi:hypothetical protein